MQKSKTQTSKTAVGMVYQIYILVFGGLYTFMDTVEYMIFRVGYWDVNKIWNVEMP